MLYVTIIIVIAIIAAAICFCAYHHRSESVWASKLDDVHNITQAMKDKIAAYHNSEEFNKYMYMFSDSEIEELINAIDEISKIDYYEYI